jgi:AmmeMemoRadiSam system protein B
MRCVARSAGACAGRDVHAVASSDLSHYHPAAVANALDAQGRGRRGAVRSGRRDGSGWKLITATPVAGGPMVAVMRAAPRAGRGDAATILRYADSGDAGDGDKSRVVGYLAAA